MTDCPSAEIWQRFLDGAIDLEEQSTLEAHLENCPHCPAVLDRLTAHVDRAWLQPTGSEVPPTHVPPSLPDLEILGEIGRGGHGVVYKALQVSLRRVVAVKVLRHGGYATRIEFERFLAEARVVAGFRHAGIVQVHSVGETVAPNQGLPYFVMEWVEGGSLSSRLDGTPFPERDAAALVETLARAAHHAHEAGIVHRDIKPGNVLLLADDRPKLTDFGLAKLAGPITNQRETLTPTTSILGTPSYMAPEQALGNSSEVGPAADIYALGAVLYELLTGRPPFKGQTPFETLLLVRDQEPVSPRALRPSLSRDLETICLRCLEKDPKRRYGDAKEFADDLARFCRGETVHARPVNRLTHFARWCRRNRGIASLAASLLSSLVAGPIVTAWLWQRAENRGEQARASADKAREALSLYTSLANKFFESPTLLGKEERRTLLRAQEVHLEILEGLDDPDALHRAATATLQIGNALHNVGESRPAADATRRATDLLRRLAEEHPDRPDFSFDFSQGCSQLGGILDNEARTAAESLDLKREAIRVGEGLLARHPKNDRYRSALAAYRTHLANTYVVRNEPDRVGDLYQAAVDDQRILVGRYPHDPNRYQFYWVAVYSAARFDLRQHGDETRYLALMREAVRLCEKVRAERADWRELAPLVLPAYQHLAWFHAGRDRLDEAIEVYQRGSALWGEIASAEGAGLQDRFTRATWSYWLGVLQSRKDEETGATTLRSALAAMATLLSEKNGVPSEQSRLAEMLTECPDRIQRDPERALALASRAVAADPNSLYFRFTHGKCLFEVGRYPEALEQFRKVRATVGPAEEPTYRASTMIYLAMARWHSGERAAARQDLQKASDLVRAERILFSWQWEPHDRAWVLIEGKVPPRPEKPKARR
jgi:serine/threonine protein kinase